SSGITDLAGNDLSDTIDEDIFLPLVVNLNNINDHLVEEPPYSQNIVDRREVVHAPIVTVAYPGYPCVLLPEMIDALQARNVNPDFIDMFGVPERDLTAGRSGRCSGGFAGQADHENDDIIPVNDLPSNRPIIIKFSKNMDKGSFVLG